jgi:alkanesulfonate monooxygenase SsuD/methylene tetrahydromethanopterin reductase-like flavin-dependent oxidoreductase (luciferase family)
MWEAMSIAGWVLAHTTTLTVGHIVLCDVLRHPAILAEQAKSLDHFSGRRFELGIGSGSVPAELERSASPATEPNTTRLAETLAILRGLWTGEPFDAAGDRCP